MKPIKNPTRKPPVWIVPSILPGCGSVRLSPSLKLPGLPMINHHITTTPMINARKITTRLNKFFIYQPLFKIY
ncbi:MAG: hypothetical protein M1419_09470 [Bacteroidetes bacterium]|nr:hypothetical protein [Bacteroidota bacterium]